jgi:hypothetical protein
MENDQKHNPTSPRLARWRIYEEISRAFKAARLREVALLTCRVGRSIEFLRKVANDWGVVIRAYRQRVALAEDVTTVGRRVTRRFFMHLDNNPPIRKSAADLIALEEEIPFGPADTFLVAPPEALAPFGSMGHDPQQLKHVHPEARGAPSGHVVPSGHRSLRPYPSL